MKKTTGICVLASAIVVCVISTLLLQGCGGRVRRSAVSGTVADINRNVVIGAKVWADNDPNRQTESLVSGVYRLEGVEGGWQTVRASAMIKNPTTGGDEEWVGSTAAEILKDEPTMNINIVLAPARETTEIGGVVSDDTGHRVRGARVLLTTRLVYPPEDTSSYDGPYGSIVAVTDDDGRYLLEDVPIGLSAIIAASKVGFRNREIEIETISDGLVQNFVLEPSDLQSGPDVPILEAIEAYTMPDTLTRSDEVDAYRAIRAFTSERYRKAITSRKQTLTRATPAGSLIEIDLYWNALDVNDSRDMAGYGIYRTTSPAIEMKAIDFVRDPYANFYSDTGVEITPRQSYYYAVSSVDVEFLDEQNRPDPAAESALSNTMSTTPLGQLKVLFPIQDAPVIGNPRFEWTRLSEADFYSVYVYDRFPTLPLDPDYKYDVDDPVLDWGIFPIWPSRTDPEESTVGGGASWKDYTGEALVLGHTYYWVVLAGKEYEVDEDGYVVRAAYSYSQLRRFTAR